MFIVNSTKNGFHLQLLNDRQSLNSVNQIAQRLIKVWCLYVFAAAQNGHKGLLADLHIADSLHAFFTFALL
jgi:hypothetical protein